MMDKMDEILEILERNARASVEEIALMLDMAVEEVEAAIKKLEEDKVIVGYSTLINWDNSSKETVTAFIEVRVTPQRVRVLTGLQSACTDTPRSKHAISCPEVMTLQLSLKERT